MLFYKGRSIEGTMAMPRGSKKKSDELTKKGADERIDLKAMSGV
jgi:hypothetical protein